MMLFVLGLLLVVTCCIICRVVHLVWNIRRKRATFVWPVVKKIDTATTTTTTTTNKNNNSKPYRTLVVLGSGGHTSEMIQLIRHLSSERYHPLLFVKAATDTTSTGRLQAANLLSSSSSSPATVVHEIPRAREVGQSYVSSVMSTLHAFFYALQLVARTRPDVLLCNGPGTCLPLCVAAFAWRVVGWTGTRIIFVESYCRVQTMSLTGRLLYAWVDLVAVHWPTLQTKYPLTQCTCTMIRHDENDKKQQ